MLSSNCQFYSKITVTNVTWRNLTEVIQKKKQQILTLVDDN